MQKNSRIKSGLKKVARVSHTGFHGRLQRITDWKALVTQSCYSGAALARLCGVSTRHLQRHIRLVNNRTLGNWLNMLRLEHGYQRLLHGCPVKETAFSLGYKQVSHFSRSFKKHFHFCPSEVPIEIGSLYVPTNEQFLLNLFPAAKSMGPKQASHIPVH